MNGNSLFASRFRGYLPVVIDVETAGFNPQTDALLEMAVVTIDMSDEGYLTPAETHAHHIIPFEGANLEPKALAFNGIDPYHPLRNAIDEKTALNSLFRVIRNKVRHFECNRAILVGHNASFDLSFVNAAANRADIKRNPLHPFSSFDTATLGGVAFGQTVLAKALAVAGIDWNNELAHSAIYDAERTAELFCQIVNQWDSYRKMTD
ncbi:MAG: ribonuclease T [Gammaproteobacteria bacterium]